MNYLENYINFLEKFLQPERKLKAVFDCSNGSVSVVLNKFLRQSLVEIILINNQPDGNFPAHGPDPLAENALLDLRRAVADNRADLGAVFDADGDRVFFADEKGTALTAAQTAALLGQDYPGPVIVDLVIGRTVKDVLGKAGIELKESRVGSLFIKEAMRKNDADFGAEFSGHFYFKDFFFMDSGVLAAFKVINAVSRMAGLNQWLAALPVYHAKMVNLALDKGVLPAKFKILENKFSREAEKISQMDGLKVEFADWWFNLRPSNTEDLVRINVEAEDEETLNRQMNYLVGFLK